MRVLGALLAGAIMIVPGVAAGASFNCAKAGTPVEKTICASEVLSSLDEQLAKAYQSALTMSDDPYTVRRQQQEWLGRVRDRCRDERCLKLVYEHRLGQLAASKPVTWKSFLDPVIGIEFSYPSDREVKTGCRGGSRCLALVGKTMPNSDYLIAFEVFDGDLETVAEANAVFRKQDGGWIARGRFGEHPVEPMAGAGWLGLKAIVDCGISDSTGFHAGAGKCLWIVLSDGRRAVVADTQGVVGIDEASLRSVRTIRFTR